MSIQSIPKATAEADLVRRAQEGDADAFATLFHTHKTRVYSLCLRMTRNTAEAEDLTQEAFLHVFRKLSSFRADSSLGTWLYRVTMNTVLMRFRKKLLPQVSLDRPNPSNPDGKPTTRELPSTDLGLAGCVDRLALKRALAELPAGSRKIFLLHEVEGYEHREIANVLRCSVGNSKSQLHKARQRIRELLACRVEGNELRPRPSRASVKSQTARKQWEPSTTTTLPHYDVWTRMSSLAPAE